MAGDGMRGVLPRRVLPALPLMLAGLVSGCGGSGRPARISGIPGYSGDELLSCVAYARQRTGHSLRGDAWQWWEAAAGRYQRTRRPAPGHVLVFARSRRLPQGHVAVVRRVIHAREIRVDHANWATAGTAARGRIAEDQPVLDVSPRNDWTEVRVWYPPIRDFGTTVFATHGFIGPPIVMAAR
ncbi:MAG: CHAP domain-containing protein [Rhodovarius sp.]|nr:CHAP domain-containing protein [Rhodovarius sp.]